MWQGKVDDDTRVAFAAETEGKMWIQEDTHGMFEDPDITLKAFRDMSKGEERPSSPENLEGPSRISSGKDPPDYGPSGGSESTDERAVRAFLHNSIKLDGVIVVLIIKEGVIYDPMGPLPAILFTLSSLDDVIRV